MEPHGREPHPQLRRDINTTVDGYEDGYNLAMLEAMATGMPVVTKSNKSTPILDGENGFCSDDTYYLNRCIDLLMKDQVLAQRLGNNARQTVAQKFSISKFINSWNRILETMALISCKFQLP